MKVTVFSLIEKFQIYNDRSQKLKKVTNAVKDDKSLDDCVNMLKEMQKEASDAAAKIKEKLETLEIDIEI